MNISHIKKLEERRMRRWGKCINTPNLSDTPLIDHLVMKEFVSA